MQRFTFETYGLSKDVDEVLCLKRFANGRKGRDVNLIAKPRDQLDPIYERGLTTLISLMLEKINRIEKPLYLGFKQG